MKWGGTASGSEGINPGNYTFIDVGKVGAETHNGFQNSCSRVDVSTERIV